MDPTPDGSQIPSARYDYVGHAAAKHCGCRGSVDCIDAMIDRLTATELQSLAALYREIARRGDAPGLSAWSRSAGPAGKAVEDLFDLFFLLGRRGLEPFDSGQVEFAPAPQPSPMDWGKLPERLSYLRGPAERYGVYWSDESRDDLELRITAAERRDLEALARRVRSPEDAKLIWEWRQAHRPNEHPESDLVQWLIQVLNEFAPEPPAAAASPATRPVTIVRPSAVLHGHVKPVWLLAFRPDGRTLASGGGAYGELGEIMVWDVAGRARVATLTGHTDDIKGLGYVAGGRVLASGSVDGTVRLWDAETQEALTILPQRGEVQHLAAVPGGPRLAVAWESADGHERGISLWDLSARAEIALVPTGDSTSLNALAVAPDGRILLWAGSDGRVVLWDVVRGAARATIGPVSGELSDLAVSPDGATLAVADSGWGSNLTLWDLRARQLLRDLGHQKAVIGIDFTPDGRFIAAACGGVGQVKMWDAVRGVQVAAFEGHTQQANAVAFSPDGRLMASCGNDREVMLWDVAQFVNDL